MVASTILSPTVSEDFLFFTPSPAFVIHKLLNDGHSDQCDVFFGEMSIKVFCPFSDWGVCLEIKSYMVLTATYIFKINIFKIYIQNT